MIDNISPENIKHAIKKYIKGGSVMPDDVKSELKEFRENIETASEEDKKYLQKAIESIVSKYPDQEQLDFIDKEDNSIEDLYGGNWYKRNNTKLLGNLKIDKSRYGKEIHVLTGDITVLNNIDAPDDFDQFIKNINIGVSDIKTTVSQQILKVENQQFLVKIIEKSNNDIGKKAVAKKVKKEESLNEDYEAQQPKLQTYQQVYQTLNEKISNEELKAYIYYKDSINQQLSDAWYLMSKYGEDTRSKNQKVKDCSAQKSNTYINFFKNKIKRNSSTSNEDINKQVLNSNYDMLVFGAEQEKLDYKLSTCCNPIPGDEVFGFITINEGIKVHKRDCPNAISLQSNYAYRIIQAKWIDSSQQEFKAILHITGMDTLGLTNKLTKVISDNMNVNIQSISLSGEAGIFNGQISVIVQNNTILRKLIDNIKQIDGVDKVTREYKN